MKQTRIQLGLCSIVGILFFTVCQASRAEKLNEKISYGDAKLQSLMQALETENEEELLRLAKEVKVHTPNLDLVAKSEESIRTKSLESPIKEKQGQGLELLGKESKENLEKKVTETKIEEKSPSTLLTSIEKKEGPETKEIKKDGKKEEKGEEPKIFASARKVLMIGDSVMEGSKAQLKKMYPNAIIDSAVSRQFTVLPEILKKTKAEYGDLPEIVVVHLGSNGTIGEKQMQEAMQLLGKRKVFFLNTKVEKPWQNPVNEFLQTQVAKYSNAKLVNWYQLSKDGNNFAKDGVHPNKTGAQLYRSLIQKTLEKEL